MTTPRRGASLIESAGTTPAGDCGLESAARSISFVEQSLTSAFDRLAAADPATRSKLLQALTAGLHLEAAAFAAGRREGEEGAEFRPSAEWSPEWLIGVVRSGDQGAMTQILSYAFGFHAARGTIFAKGAKHALRPDRG